MAKGTFKTFSDKIIETTDTNKILKDLMSSSHLTVNILFATMNEIKEHTIGHMIIQIAGETTQVSEAFSYLSEADVNVKELFIDA